MKTYLQFRNSQIVVGFTRKEINALLAQLKRNTGIKKSQALLMAEWKIRNSAWDGDDETLPNE